MAAALLPSSLGRGPLQALGELVELLGNTKDFAPQINPADQACRTPHLGCARPIFGGKFAEQLPGLCHQSRPHGARAAPVDNPLLLPRSQEEAAGIGFTLCKCSFETWPPSNGKKARQKSSACSPATCSARRRSDVSLFAPPFVPTPSIDHSAPACLGFRECAARLA